ncbi:protein-disulfide reductase DsbD domain-containing protein [Paracoccus sp. (in: a-proteobacteria)]|uniref:protein-disulfide reductase DsbD domain-containing protein n=1 Tax=Paracoccus sp. TaxID=267 RepID=UPI003A856869
MKPPACLALALTLTALPALSEDLPPGLVSARLLPGWTDSQGNRVSALELRLQPGWKTYWRSPGDTGLPPDFDWGASENLAGVTFHWPAPQAIRSGGDITLGYHDLLVLPFTATPADPGKPLVLAAEVDLGICERICVPVHVALQAPAPAPAPSASIKAALRDVPALVADSGTCALRDIADGMQLEVLLPRARIEVAAMEVVDRPDIWVSIPLLLPEDGATRATADFVAPTGAPFDLDVSQVRFTLIGPDGAVEMLGCDLQG